MFSSVIIGEGNIALSCLHHLLALNQRVDKVITNTKSLITFCQDASIDTAPRRKNLESVLKDKSYDYLFSVNNPSILSPEVLSYAKKLNINFHDSLLPGYAGVHATSWALINRETTHGISWHIVEPGIDTGDILQSQRVTIDDNESALTLNLKCVNACLDAFKRLIDDIIKDNLKPSPQDPTRRSYFGLYQLPPNLGILSLEQDTEDIYAIARAMEFGTHDNQLGSPMIFTPSGSFLLVTKVSVWKELGNESPELPSKASTVLSIDGNTLLVATNGDPICLTLAELNGYPLRSNTLLNSGLKKGVEIHSIAGLDMENATQLRKKEPFWRRTMRSYEATTFFVQKLNVLSGIIDSMEEREIKTTEIPFPDMLSEAMQRKSDEFLLSSFLAFLARSCCSTQIHVGLVASKKNISDAYKELYSNICPAIFDVDFSSPAHDEIRKISQKMNIYHEASTFLVNMFYRYPELREIITHPHHNMVIALGSDSTMDSSKIKTLLSDSNLLILIGAKKISVSYADKLCNSYSRVEDVLHHFPTFLASMASKESSLPLQDIDYIPQSEKQALYGAPERQEMDRSIGVLQYLYEIVRENPDDIAISSSDTTVSYQDLFHEVDNLASMIEECLPDEYRTNVKCIAIHLPNSIAYVISLLASLTANRPFLPLPENLPINRLSFTLQDSRANLLLTSREVLVSEKFEELQPRVLFETSTKYGDLAMLYLGNNQPCSQQNQPPSALLHQVYSFSSLNDFEQSDAPEETPLDPNCCYIIYTSGSTGKPKGVQLLQSGLLNMAMAQIEKWDLGPGDVIAQFASIGFDASISEIFTALLAGATLAVLKDAERLGQEFTRTMTKLRVTTITLPPSVLNIYKPSDFPTLEKVVTAGEACTLSTAARWTEHTSLRFFNAYGPTESTVCATIHEFDRSIDDVPLSQELPIGKVIRGVQIYLLDDLMRPVPPNVVGEIFIGGQNLSAGYIGHATSRNAERFIDNPIFPGSKLYKTGDHAIQAKNGSLTFIGRMDDQVKIRGHRIVLNEIEQVLLQHTKVETAVVVKFQPSPQADPSIAAFIAPTFVFESELREYLSKALPNYMIPNHIKKMNMEDFPLTINGKIDRKKLEKDKSVVQKHSKTGSSHLNSTQLKMAKLWCHVLQLDESYAYSMHRLSSLTEHGGNSLHMVLLQTQIEKEFGTLFSFTEIGAASTIQDFADMVSDKNNVPEHTTKPKTMSKEELRNLIIEDSTFDPVKMKIPSSELVPRTKSSQFCPKNILLSGTTGFLGAFLVHEILEQTEAHVCCMVRETTEVRGFGRVVSNMKKYNLWKTTYEARIAIVLSDLAEPDMGIAPDIYTALTIEIDTVFMNAAKMNFNTDYNDHRDANVLGTNMFIKFCFTGRKKYLFATSTLGVFLFPDKMKENENDAMNLTNMDHNGNHHQVNAYNWSNKIFYSQDKEHISLTRNLDSNPRVSKCKSIYSQILSNHASLKQEQRPYCSDCKDFIVCKPKHCVTKSVDRVLYKENDNVQDPSVLSGGYNQSKWAAEQLIRQALPYLPGGAIFRPARITGHSKSGIGPTNDLFACTLKGVEGLKCAPNMDFPYDLTPVDYCARGMIEIMTQIYKPENSDMPLVYHFFNQSTMSFIDLFEGTEIEKVNLKDWRVRVRQADRENVLVPFFPFIQSDFWDRSPDWPIFSTENTSRYISTECSNLLLSSKQLLSVYRSFFFKL